jgi:hypothetical protein
MAFASVSLGITGFIAGLLPGCYIASSLVDIGPGILSR